METKTYIINFIDPIRFGDKNEYVFAINNIGGFDRPNTKDFIEIYFDSAKQQSAGFLRVNNIKSIL